MSQKAYKFGNSPMFTITFKLCNEDISVETQSLEIHVNVICGFRCRKHFETNLAFPLAVPEISHK